MSESNLIFVAAAGNNGWDIDKQPVFPAAFDLENVLSVASISSNGFLSGFSNYGQASVDVASPGENIISTIPGDDVGYKNGTSMAAAFVSGEVALLLGQNSQLSIDQIRSKINDSADKLSSLMGKINGGKKINVGNAIKDTITNEIIDVIGSPNVFNPNQKYPIEQVFSLFTDSAQKHENKLISAGLNHNLLMQDGIVWAWGANGSGQLGDGTTEGKSSPIQVIGLNNVISV